MTHPTRQAAIRRVLWITLFANLAVAAAKLVIGLLSRSLAMAADGLHSSLDSLSNVIGLASNMLAARPPDANHPYGHRRFETLASLMIGGILLLTGWEIVKSSIGRLAGGEPPQAGVIQFAVMAGTLVINLGVALYERRMGKRYNSELLLADSEHTRSDVLVSITVIASLIAVRFGLAWVDAVTALVVVGLILFAAGRIVRRSAGILVDRAALDAASVAAIAGDVAGIQAISRIRSRGPADDIHLDLDVQVAGPTTAEHSAAIAKELRARLREQFSGLADIEVHFLPVRNTPLDLGLAVRAEADALGLGVHEIIPSTSGGRLSIEMHVEVPADRTVGQAHAEVTELEVRLRAALPELDRVVTHIEPAPILERPPSRDDEAHLLARRALGIAENLYPDNVWHDLDVRAEPDGGYALSMHCHVAEDMKLEDAHHIAEVVETQVRAALPEVHRVTIHTEPPDVP